MSAGLNAMRHPLVRVGPDVPIRGSVPGGAGRYRPSASAIASTACSKHAAGGRTSPAPI